MEDPKRCIVVQCGTYRTVAGFHDSDVPGCVLPTCYAGEEMVFGGVEMIEYVEDHESKPGVYTVLDSRGLPYNWLAWEALIKHLYECLGAHPAEHPLVLTIPATALSGTEIDPKIMQKFEEVLLKRLGVPVFQLVIEPLALALGLGKSSALVVDMGHSACQVTPIVDGTIVRQGLMRSKYGGAYLDYEIASFLKKITTAAGTNGQNAGEPNGSENNNKQLDPTENDASMQIDEDSAIVESTKAWIESHTTLYEFKQTQLEASDRPLVELERHIEQQNAAHRRQQQTLLQMRQQQNPNTVSSTPVTDHYAPLHDPLNNKRPYLYKGKTLHIAQRDRLSLCEGVFEAHEEDPGLSALLVRAVQKAAAGAAGPTAQQSTNNSSPSSHGALAQGFSGHLTAEQVCSSLLGAVVITGGVARTPGVASRVVHSLATAFPQYRLAATATAPAPAGTAMEDAPAAAVSIADVPFGAWSGACALARLPAAWTVLGAHS